MYENLSLVYDRLMDADYDTYINIISQELEGKKNLLVLDLGCGSGTMLPELEKYGKVFAIDNSEQMLAIASEKAPNCNFFKMDILEITSLGEKFDFILSAFDVFNYLENFNEFKEGLSEVYFSLRKGGKFVFDIHTPYKINFMLENKIFAYEEDDISYIWFTYGTKNSLEVESELTFFVKEKDNLYKKLEQYQKQRTYSIESILEEIRNIGFKINKYFCDFDLENQNYENSERIIFVLEK
ncbi:class I SAM-dependent DNA methyltransferase [Gemella cuniculi]|uniref:class I SAM-dependent DNA methyltransferase n=1 Tax=Gemella cuniculi TaxID=150240 RepID=UPI000406BD52|nr:class I SAM-dependent methyltransferase [Gemella cuniculi]